MGWWRIEWECGGLHFLDLGGRDVITFHTDWMKERVRLLKNDALGQIKKNVDAYTSSLAEFEVQYTNLLGEQEILERWYTEDKTDLLGSSAQQMRDKKIMVGHLFAIRKSLVGLNRFYSQVAGIEGFS